METIKASVVTLEDKHFIKIETADDEVKIPISDDKPNEVKSAFNKLIAWTKNGEFEIKLDNVDSDLFSQVANEYITQLNREIQEIRSEMDEFGLLDAYL